MAEGGLDFSDSNIPEEPPASSSQDPEAIYTNLMETMLAEKGDPQGNSDIEESNTSKITVKGKEGQSPTKRGKKNHEQNKLCAPHTFLTDRYTDKTPQFRYANYMKTLEST